METIIKGMQVTNVKISKNCRKVHGNFGSYEVASGYVKEKFLDIVNLEVNKDAIFNLCLTVDRNTKN